MRQNGINRLTLDVISNNLPEIIKKGLIEPYNKWNAEMIKEFIKFIYSNYKSDSKIYNKISDIIYEIYEDIDMFRQLMGEDIEQEKIKEESLCNFIDDEYIGNGIYSLDIGTIDIDASGYVREVFENIHLWENHSELIEDVIEYLKNKVIEKYSD